MPTWYIYINVESISLGPRLSVKDCWIGELGAMKDELLDIVLSGYLLGAVEFSDVMAVPDVLKAWCMVCKLVDVADAMRLVDSM